MFIHLDRWHIQKLRNDQLMFISAYIFLYADNVVTPSSHIINNHLKGEHLPIRNQNFSIFVLTVFSTSTL